jgi:inner membrane protein
MGKWWQTTTAKVLGVAALALLMTLPLARVDALVRERQQLRQAAVGQVAQGWGGQQVLGGPVLVVPTRQLSATTGQAPQWHTGSETILADTLTMDVDMTTSTRHYGIYDVPVFASTVKLQAVFRAADLARYHAASTADWQTGKAELHLPVGDLRGLQAVDSLQVDGKPVRFDATDQHLGPWPVVSVPIDLDAQGDRPIVVTATLKLAGSESLQLAPLARVTDVSMHAPWPDPSFTGAALPLEHRVGPAGFDARWRRLDLNRSYGQHWHGHDRDIDGALSASIFGVALYQPANVYQRNVRAGKYGLLFIALSFVVFFLFEVLKRLRVHPVQYLMVGAALSTFYVVLLALSEQIGFGAAYVVASAAVVLIVGGYAAAILRTRRAGWVLGGALGLTYAMLYGLIAAEQYALLAGALVLLAVVALMMFLTRHIDWYACVPAPDTAPSQEKHPA